MASHVTRVEIPNVIARDFSVQAAATDAYADTRPIADAACAVRVASPLLDLYGESVRLGNGCLDMVSVVEAIAARTDLVGGPPQPD